MEADAQGYDELNQPQIENGSKFIRELRLFQGGKVLDMGCGTGDVTKFIAETVGFGGQVVGIEPDAARVKIAKEKFKDVSNLQFHVGSSATGFPHDSEPYYDVHVSTSAFHWVPDDEKKIYIQKAHECLKPGGKLAILCSVKVTEDSNDENFKELEYYPLTADAYRKLFQDVGLFTDVVVENIIYTVRCKSFEEFKRWVKVSTHHDMDDVDPTVLKEKMAKFFTMGDDGSVTLKHPAVTIIAKKI